MKGKWTLFFALIVPAVFCQSACADAGTPLMWATAVHLLFGNALIGIAEGVLLGWLFAAPMGRSLFLLVLANYTSAWTGALLIRWANARALPIDLNNGWTWFWGAVVATYCITLVLEWPFFALCFLGSRNWFRRSIWGTLALVTASYLVLFGWYRSAGPTTLYTRMHVVAANDIPLPPSATVYYIAPADGNVYARELSGVSARQVYELGSNGWNDRLFVRPNPTDGSRWDLMARVDGGSGKSRSVEVVSGLTVEAARDLYLGDDGRTEGTWFNFGDVPRLGTATGSNWTFSSGFWAAEGLHGLNRATGDSVWFAYDTPFQSWIVRNAVLLPSDKILLQLGKDQICAVDPATRKIALLWRGRGPVAIIPQPKADMTNGSSQTLGVEGK